MRRDPQSDPDLSSDQALDDLLGQAYSPKASPMFTHNVLRSIRLAETTPTRSAPFVAKLVKKPFVALTIAAASVCCVLVIVTLPQTVPNNTDIVKSRWQFPANTIDPSLELESIYDRWAMMTATDPGSLSDEALADLLF